MVAVVIVVVMPLLPSIPFVITPGDDEVPTLCACGCDNPRGACCCSAPKDSPLAFTCLGRDDPNELSDGVSPVKLIGPPDSIELSRPIQAAAAHLDREAVFKGPDPRPEIPPPRA